MGFFRFFLALLICIMHAKAQGVLPKSWLPDLTGLTLDPKINIFFMMAGFFSHGALVSLRRRKVHRWAWEFWRSRCLRLWPAYWVCVLATYLLIQCCNYEITPERLMPGLPWWQFVLYNMIPFTPGILEMGNLPNSWFAVVLVFVVLQAWTLALIMPLFLLAPALMLVPGISYVLFGLSLWGLYHAYAEEMEFQAYLIIALPYFLAGFIAYDVYEKWYARRALSATLKGVTCLATALLVLMFANYSAFLGMWGMHASNWVGVGVGWCLLPPLFALSRRNRYDWYLSNLSYTLYLSHFLVTHLYRRSGLEMEVMQWLVLPSCLLLAAALHQWVERPVARWRGRSAI